MELATGAQLGPFVITAAIGKDGMGEVYRARDTRLGREVALKVLPPGLVDAERLRRFLREARAASLLNHPNIVTIYDIVEIDGMHILVMEYVEGKPLSEVVSKAAVNPADVERYARQIASALSKAHSEGIIHRDLKPANIMITSSGVVKLLDFGIAKFTDTPVDESNATLTDAVTRTGMVIGTAAYMSPEQAQGQPVDARSDLFALGAVMYEMLSGERAFRGESAVAVMAAVVRDEPAPLRNTTALNPVVARCLRKDPSERYQSAAQVEKELTGAAVTPQTKTPSLVVLPFVNQNRDEEGEFLADGITEDLINALSRVQGLKVMARSVAFLYKGMAVEAREVGSKLGVSAILEGSLRRAGKRLRVNVELVNVADGFSTWSERYDRQVEDVFDIQDEISRAIVDALKLRLGAQGQLAPKQTSNMAAYQFYQTGRAHWATRNPDSIRQAMTYYRQALELDSEYALALVGLADCYSVLGFWGVLPPGESTPEARRLALRAQAIDPDLGETYATLGFLAGVGQRDLATSVGMLRKAATLSPSVAYIRLWLGLILSAAGRHEEALAEVRAGREFDPITQTIHAGEGVVLTVAGRSREAEAALRETYAMGTRNSLVNMNLAHTLSRLDRWEEAVEVAKGTAHLQWRHSVMAWLYGWMGRRGEATGCLAELLTLASHSFVSETALGMAYLGAGDEEQGFGHLEAGEVDGDMYLFWITATGFFDNYRDRPRFQALRRNLNLG